MNTLKTFILMAVLTILVIWIGQLMGGRSGMMMAFMIAGVMNFVSYWFSDKIVLMMYGAKEIKPGELPRVQRAVQHLALQANLPMPRLYFINTPMPNAFATGRDPQHAAVAVTAGILDILDDKELSGVIAHELSHVKNRDILISTIAATAAGAIFMMSRMAQFAAIFGGGSRDREGGSPLGMLVVAIVAPLAAMIIQMAISRSREYQADATGARMLGDPLALASALRKLTLGVKEHPVEVNPATAHMFFVSPFSVKSLLTLFSTHPPMEERIKRLEALAQEVNPYAAPKIIY
jgi:heat shock protein HtpX